MSTRMLLSLFVVFVVSCAREGERSDNPIVVQPKSNAGSCLSKFRENFKNYQEGKLSESEIAEFWDCTAGAVAEFSRLTTSPQRGGYHPQAIWRFLHKYFLVGQDIDDELLSSIMELKRLMVGGTAKTVTKSELGKLIAFTEELKTITLELRPHIRVLMNSDAGATSQQVQAANLALLKAMNLLSIWVGQQNQSYSFAQMRTFVEGLARNSGRPEDWKSWIDAIEILSRAKGLAVALPAETILSDQWTDFLTTVGQAYGLFVRWHYQVQGHVLLSLASPAIRESAGTVVDILERGVRARKSRSPGIPIREFDGMFKAISDAGIFGQGLPPEAFSEAFRWAVARLLSRETDRSIPPVKEFNLLNIAALRALLKDWSDLNDFALQWPQGSANTPRLREFTNVLKTSWPLRVDPQGRTVYPSIGSHADYDSKSLQVLSWQFLAIAWIRDSYVPDGQWEIATERMELAVSEILPLIQNFNLLTTQQPTVYLRLMKEGDLFMPGSDGNLVIGVAEGTHFLNGLISALASGNVWNSVVGATCGTPADRNCYSDAIYLNRDVILAGMPRLKGVLDGQTLEQWRTYFKKVQLTAIGEAADRPWDAADRTLAWMLLEYLETFVQKYDANQSETIRLSEANQAFRGFEANLQKLFSPLGMPPEDIYPFFTFMMKNGETYFERFGGQIEFIHWKLHLEEWQFEADRNTLVNILFELSKL